jgi:hypothetical protein
MNLTDKFPRFIFNNPTSVFIVGSELFYCGFLKTAIRKKLLFAYHVGRLESINIRKTIVDKIEVLFIKKVAYPNSNLGAENPTKAVVVVVVVAEFLEILAPMCSTSNSFSGLGSNNKCLNFFCYFDK